MSSPLPNTIELTKNKDFLVKGTNLAAGIDFVSVTDPATREALINNEPFPKEAKLVDIKITGEAGRDLAFDGKKGTVSFKAGGNVFAGLGVYLSAQNLINDLQLDDNIEAGLDLGDGLNEYLLALRWGYGASAEAQGSIALGAAGQLTFGADAATDAAYAVIRRFPQDTKAYTAVTALANSWKLPTHVKTVDDLEPGTWLVAEVNGSVAANIGIQYGLNFNWIRELDQGGLTGDIGLRLQLGLQASLGFSASGKYAVVLGRESLDPNDKEVRLRIFKQRQKGWNFALSAGAQAQAEAGFLPDNYDDLIKAVFGVQGAQIVKGLDTFDKWTNTQESLPEILSGAGLQYAQDMLQTLTGKDPATEFDDARQQVLNFLNEWTNLDNLNHRASTLIWKFLGEMEDKTQLEGALNEIKELAGEIQGLNGDKVVALLKDRITDIEFFKTPVGQWLESIAGGDILRVLNDSAALKDLQQAAGATLGVLDGGPVEEMLGKLQSFIQTNLGDQLKKVEEIQTKISQTDFNTLNQWLNARLTDFLGSALDLDKLETIRQALQKIRAQSENFYTKGLAALTKQYNFSFAYTYQSSTTATALLDVVFDLAQADPAWLPDAVDGQFNQLLVKQNPGVTLREAHLTHQIERNSSVDISTPFFSKNTQHSNTSFADYTPTEADGKLLMTYSLNAEDIVTVQNRLMSQLAIGGSWTLGESNGVRVYSKSGLSYTYSFRQIKQDMGRADLEYQLQPYADAYFKNAFSTQSAGATSATLDNWLSYLDETVEPALNNGPDQFGDTLLSLQLSVPAAIVEAWMNAPEDDKDDRYMNLSIRLQQQLKYLVPYLYLQDPNKLTAEQAVAGVLAYAAFPSSTRITGNSPPFKFDTRTGVYWDYLNPDYYRAMLSRSDTAARMGDILRGIQTRLNNTPQFKGLADDYAPSRAGVFLNYANNHPVGAANLKALLNFESKVISGAVKAGKAIAEFKEKSPDKPAEAIEALAQFGADVTKTFNSSLSKLHGGDKSRPMATLLFIEAAKAFNPALATATGNDPAALLELIVLTKNSAFKSNMTSYLTGTLPDKADVLVQPRIVNA